MPDWSCCGSVSPGFPYSHAWAPWVFLVLHSGLTLVTESEVAAFSCTCHCFSEFFMVVVVTHLVVSGSHYVLPCALYWGNLL